MNHTTNPKGRVAGPRIILIGVLIVVIITGFVIVRVLQTRGPEPEPVPVPVSEETAEETTSDQYLGFIASPDSTLFEATFAEELVTFFGTVTGHQILSEPGFWAVDYTWFFLPGPEEQLLTFEEVDSLATEGVLADTTRIGTAVYRIRVEGATEDEARAAARLNQPTRVPPLVEATFRSRPGAAPLDSLPPR